MKKFNPKNFKITDEQFAALGDKGLIVSPFFTLEQNEYNNDVYTKAYLIEWLDRANERPTTQADYTDFGLKLMHHLNNLEAKGQQISHHIALTSYQKLKAATPIQQLQAPHQAF